MVCSKPTGLDKGGGLESEPIPQVSPNTCFSDRRLLAGEKRPECNAQRHAPAQPEPWSCIRCFPGLLPFGSSPRPLVLLEDGMPVRSVRGHHESEHRPKGP